MFSRGFPETPSTLLHSNAQNPAIGPISIWGSTGSDMLDSAR